MMMLTPRRRIRLPFGWVGSKARLAPSILPLLPLHSTWVEPFCGTAAMTFAKPRSSVEVINDLDPGLINYMRCLREMPMRLMAACEDGFCPEVWRESLIERASGYTRTADPIARARLFYIGAKCGYRQLNNTRTFDPSKERGYHSTRHRFPLFASRLERVSMTNSHYATCIATWDDQETLFFCDPPYLMETRCNRSLYRYDMGAQEDHLALLQILRSVRGKVILCGYPSDLYSRELKGWRTHTYQVIKGTSPTRATATEQVWLNF